MTQQAQPKAKFNWWKLIGTVIVTLLIAGIFRMCMIGNSSNEGYEGTHAKLGTPEIYQGR